MIHFCSWAQSGEKVFQLHQEDFALQREVPAFSSQLPHLVSKPGPKSAESPGFILQTFAFLTSKVTGMVAFLCPFYSCLQNFPPLFLD